MGLQKLKYLGESTLKLFWILYDVLYVSGSEKLVLFISKSVNWNWNISQPNHGVRARTSSPLALHHISTVAKGINPYKDESLLLQFHQQFFPLCQIIENIHCISTLTRVLGDGTLYVSKQCIGGGRGYRDRQGSKSLPLPIASRPHFKIITLKSQLNIIQVSQTHVLSNIKKGVCYEEIENFCTVQFSSGQTSGWFAITNCQKWPHQEGSL